MKRTALSVALATTLSWACPGIVHAVDDSGDRIARTSQSLDKIVVTGDITYRNRSDDTAPLLSYDLEYFQRFEPLTVGDMLKRVPSVTFVSDVLEYDGARLRGLDPAYTQILINGRKVPGAGDDRSFFVDRIPAELVERIEIIRSASANRSGDAVAGALNIVLRDAWAFDGSYLRAGALRYDDGDLKGSYGAVTSTDLAGGRLLLGLNVQGRRNPKTKTSLRFDGPGGEFDDRELQSDVRDGTDTSANLSFTREIGAARIGFDGFAVRTDRDETEHSEEFNDPTLGGREHLLSVNDQFERIEQRNHGLAANIEFFAAGGENTIELDAAGFDEHTVNTERETGFDDDDSPPSFDELEGVREGLDIDDSEFGASFAHQRAFGAAQLELGMDLQRKRRDIMRAVSEVDTDEEGVELPPFADFDRSVSRIEETRMDPYLMLSGGRDALRWEAGMRYEDTRSEIGVDDAAGIDNDHGLLLPSAHLRWDISERDRLHLSAARTVRRPDFNLLLPVLLEGEFGDNDFIGNPTLAPETALGFDVGFERRLGRQGVVGVNLFYRAVDDLIEVISTGEPSATAIGDFEDDVEDFLDENPGAGPGSPGYPEFDPDSFVHTSGNVGDGHVYGIELDLSTPLTAIGLPDTGLFLNYAWLDSSVDDALGERPFNNQARYVYNVGFIHDLDVVGISFGTSYRRQGTARSRLLAEEVVTQYGADLEAFIEKRFGNRLTLRMTGSNLLDASKDEFFDKFDTLADQLDRDHDEFELESEKSGRVYSLVARYSF